MHSQPMGFTGESLCPRRRRLWAVVLCSHKFWRGGGEFIFLCSCSSLIMAGNRRVRPSLSKDGWNDQLDQLAFMFVLYGDGMKFEQLADSTFYFSSGSPSFPQHLRQYANSTIQNLRKKIIRGSERLPQIDNNLPSFFKPNEYIDQFFARKRIDDMDDDSSVEEFHSGKSPHRSRETLRNALKNKSPSRGINHSERYRPDFDPVGAKPLVNSSHMDANPLGLWVTIGNTPRISDAGDRFSNWIRITYHLRSAMDAKHIKMAIAMVKEDNSLGQSLLEMSFPANSMSQLKDYQMLEGNAEHDMQTRNVGNMKFLSNLQARLEKAESQLAEFGSLVNVKTMLLRLPIDPATGKPYTCHNLYWQGETHLDTTLPEPGHLIKYEASIDEQAEELLEFGAGDELVGSRRYLSWYIAISGDVAQGMRLRAPSVATPPRSKAEKSNLAARFIRGYGM